MTEKANSREIARDSEVQKDLHVAGNNYVLIIIADTVNVQTNIEN